MYGMFDLDMYRKTRGRISFVVVVVGFFLRQKRGIPKAIIYLQTAPKLIDSNET